MTKTQIDFHQHLAERRQKISDFVQRVHTGAVEGDIAEFGVSYGNSLEVIAATMAYCDTAWPKRRLTPRFLHAYDSFEGFPAANLPGDADSPMVAGRIWGPGNCPSPGVTVIMGMVNRHLPQDRLIIYPGWFKDTMHTTPPEVRFSLVNLDCDLYESTRDVLEFLFETNRLSDGCVLIFDDFLENRASRKFGQRKAWEEAKTKWKPDFTDLGYYAAGCWHCVIHRD
jgi:O-methyltransferase